MRRTPHLITALLASLITLPTAALAQDSARASSGQPQQIPLPPSVQAVFELQGLQSRLTEVRQQAFADSAIAATAQATEAFMMKRMKAIDPEADAYLDQLRTIEKRYRSARRMRDSVYMEELAARGRPLGEKVDSLRRQVLAQKDVAARVDSFQDLLRAKMIEIEPKLDSLEARATDLYRKVQELRKAKGAGGS